ncbi:MAG TPA: hypothetical protein VF624_00270 [Tepidisphaeraceae bacterium]|jgi:hypothetical protein
MKRLLSLCVLATLIAGCSASTGPSLMVQKAESDTAYSAQFDRAYFTQTANGQVDVVLLSDGQGPSPEVDRPLQTSTDKTVRQIVHLRVLWANPRGIRLDNPSASNAMLTWHVLASATDRVAYTGSAWTKVSVDGNEATLDIRNASVAVHKIVGGCDDPLKRASLSGEIVARRADATVRSYLNEISNLEKTESTALLPSRAPVTP